MDWKVLGIEETKDKALITAAYREKLKTVNPEDKPEEFMALRENYEEALRLADLEEKPEEEDLSPLGLWKKELKTIYDDFERRINVDEWKKLLSEDVCVALDTRADCENAMLSYFMEYYYLPQEVWIYLDEEFSLIERVEELYERYPKDFIDYVIINGVRFGERLPYKLFYPGKNGADCDSYIKLFNKVSRTPWEEMAPIFEDIDKLSEAHPYGDSLKLRCLIHTDGPSHMDELLSLCDKYPGDGYLLMEAAEEYYGLEKWTECEELCKKVKKEDGDYTHARRLHSYSLAKQGKFEEAIKLLNQMMSDAGGDRKQLYELSELRKEWNESLISKYEKDLEENPGNQEVMLDLAWCYLQNDRNEDSFKVAEKLDENAFDVFDYNNLMGQVYLSVGRANDAIPCMDKLIAYLKDLKPDGTEETDRRIGRYQEMLERKAGCLYEAGRIDDALAAYKEAEDFDPNNSEVLTMLAELFIYRKDFEKALEYCKRLTITNPGSYHGFFLLASTYFQLKRDRDAFDAINRAMDIDGRDLSAYVLKIRILIRNGVYDEAKELIKYVRDNGVTDAPPIDALDALIFLYEGGEAEEALKRLNEIAKKIEEGEYLGFETEIYYRIASLTANIADKENRVARKEILEYLEKGLKFTPDDPDSLDYKAWILKKEGRSKEALEIYKGLEKLPRNNLDVEKQIAEIYYEDLDFKAKESLEYYQKLLDDKETADSHFYVGMCYFYMDDYDNAKKHFLREQELEPNVLDGFFRMAMVCEATGEYEEALKQMLKVIDIVEEIDKDQSRYYSHLAQIYRRLRRPYDAVEAIKTALDKYGYAKANKEMFETFMQFGLFDEAEKVLKRWKMNKNQMSDWLGKENMLQIAKGEKIRARLFFADRNMAMNGEDRDVLEIYFGSSDKKLHTELRIHKKAVDDALKNGWQLFRPYSNYAFTLFKAGRLEEAVRMADKAVEAHDKECPQNHRYKALYESKNAINLALLGNFEKGKKLLEEVRKMPLCENCKYPSCKDADIFEVELAIIDRKYKTALELCEDYQRKWPDETDFVILKNYVISKGLDK